MESIGELFNFTDFHSDGERQRAGWPWLGSSGGKRALCMRSPDNGAHVLQPAAPHGTRLQ
jgi:hypothetical protein